MLARWFFGKSRGSVNAILLQQDPEIDVVLPSVRWFGARWQRIPGRFASRIRSGSPADLGAGVEGQLNIRFYPAGWIWSKPESSLDENPPRVDHDDLFHADERSRSMESHEWVLHECVVFV
jgi:hypothetical protein